ncbi:MAG: DUF2156 domain-containing protein [Planctomycetes bacterium]|nr:DUF2156 domain-containing protein [Planctomycetota bacterium]
MPTLAQIESSPELARRFSYLRRYGQHSTGYFTLQPGLDAFFVERLGFVSYQRWSEGVTTLGGLLPRAFVLSEPIALPEHRITLLEQFLAHVKSACFLQLSAATAHWLGQCGYKIVPMGTEVDIDLASFTLAGSRRRNLRQTVQSARRHGLHVVELTAAEARNLPVEELSQRWMQRRRTRNRELRFLTRPLVTEAEHDVRRFFAFADDTLLGYVHFDPLYENEQTIGYTANIVRTHPDAPSGTADLIKVTAIEQFRSEGKRTLALGYCPLGGMRADDPLANNSFLAWLCQMCGRYANWLYSFRGLYFHKHRYAGEERPVYFATRTSAILDCLRTFQLCGVL